MLLVAILFSLFFAIIFTGLFAIAFRNTGPWSGFWAFFLVVFLFSFAAGQWVVPIGPHAWGFYWLPGLLAAVIVATQMAAVASGSKASRYKRAQNLKKNISSSSYYSHHDPGTGGSPLYNTDEDETGVILGAFFWTMLVTLMVIALAGALM
ncbi:MAG TPA: hypothetical protein VIK89_06685 [Cytophagaceae bacterium]